MQNYLSLLRQILLNGDKVPDRTGVGTTSLFGTSLTYTLDDRGGNVVYNFPAVTTKKLAWKSVVSELLWFLEGSTNERRLAEIKENEQYKNIDKKLRKTIWSLNASHQGKELGYVSGGLGRIYPHQWRNIYDIDYSQYEIVDDYHFEDNYVERNFPVLVPEQSNDENIGKFFTNKNNLKYQIISKSDYVDKSGHKNYYQVQFTNTHSTKIARIDAIKDGRVQDDYAIRPCGYGKLGEISEDDKTQEIYPILFAKWSKMLERCYNPKCKEYSMYGAKGVYVCKRWHTFSNFLEDCTQLMGFEDFLDDHTYQIDKDIFNDNVYSKETCVFIPKFYNQQLINSKPIVYNDKIYMNVECFCRENDWAFVSGLTKHLHGRYTSKYANVHYVEIPKGKHIRYKITRHDQISELVNGILKDPFSRRHIVSAWNVSDLDKMALPPCHVLQQYHVVPDHSGKPEYLDLNMYQRSADMFLGVPFNIASYALLLCIIARKTGLKARNLNMFFGDSHVYNNHIDAVHEQLERNPYALPSLELPDIAKVDEMTVEWTPEWSVNDFKLINYRHHEPIKAKMAV